VKYMLLINSDPAAWAKVAPEDANKIFEEYGAYTQALHDSKEYVNGDPVQGNETAKTVRVSKGKPAVTDGPFSTAAALAGYYTVDVKDLDRALELAATIPGAAQGLDAIEVRPIMDLG
jgi:hypothetical protein